MLRFCTKANALDVSLLTFQGQSIKSIICVKSIEFADEPYGGAGGKKVVQSKQ